MSGAAGNELHDDDSKTPKCPECKWITAAFILAIAIAAAWAAYA